MVVILLSLITLGIYSLYWQYASFKELRAYAPEKGSVVDWVFSSLFSSVS